MAGKNKWAAVIIACMATFIIVLDSSAMNVAIGALVEPEVRYGEIDYSPDSTLTRTAFQL